MEFQLDLFDDVTTLDSRAISLTNVRRISKTSRHKSVNMVKAWKQGNVQELETLLVGMGEYPELNQALVINRNKDWLPYIEEALQEKEPVFMSW